ncbi:alpha/beta hydrolase [Phycicoccus endophyticus]|uniref:Alpha/beta hydrolase n=2 Tax=Phycicoccus endophyticus TaxID=1690220 RepID=A0A7G9R689_9MICO|nr:alpha/beta hydrolase [Phycicoccus endophyticus]QNN51114.1 alpha/beta hydrolase [Phycicoccus endophyticus]
MTLESLRPVGRALAHSRAVHAFERPGHGRSPDVPGEYSYARGVEQALAYLDLLGLDSAHVVGYSDGAVIGLLLARDHPRRVRSLVSVSGNLDPSGFAVEPEELDAALALAGTAPDGMPDPDRELHAALSPDGPAHGDIVLDKLRRLWRDHPRVTPASLRTVRAPTLVLAGEHDAVRPEHSALIAAALPDGYLHLVPEATHALLEEHPEVVCALVVAFVEEHAAG